MRGVVASIKRFILRKKIIQKTYDGWAIKNYQPNPIISFVIQSHNRSGHVELLVQKLRSVINNELIVIDDGSSLEHTTRLGKLLTQANEFLIRCNDLYEVITYDRALNFAKGKYVVLLQDDDDFDTIDWVEEGVQCFLQDDHLAILGGRDGLKLLPYDKDEIGVRGDFHIDGDIAYRVNSFKIALKRTDEFAYTQFVNRAPMWLQRDLFTQVLKSIDVSFAPFQWDDAELCLRAWLVGLRVGHYSAKFKIGGLGTGGMQIWNNELHQRQDEVNAKLLYSKYNSHLNYVNSLVDTCNRQMLMH